MKTTYVLSKLFEKIQVCNQKIYKTAGLKPWGLVRSYLTIGKFKASIFFIFSVSSVFSVAAFLGRSLWSKKNDFLGKFGKKGAQSAKYDAFPTLQLQFGSFLKTKYHIDINDHNNSTKSGNSQGNENRFIKTDKIYALWRWLSLALHLWVLQMVLWARFPSGIHYLVLKSTLCLLIVFLCFRYLRQLNWQQSLASLVIEHTEYGLSFLCIHRNKRGESSNRFIPSSDLLVTRFLIVIPLKVADKKIIFERLPLTRRDSKKTGLESLYPKRYVSEYFLFLWSRLHLFVPFSKPSLVFFPGLIDEKQARELRRYLLLTENI